MSTQTSRRDFLRSAALTGMGVYVATRSWAQDNAPSERINFACIGVGGKGESDTDDVAHFGNVVAICDVDTNALNRMGEKYPKARKYTDFRKMLDEMGNQIDAVTVSTPDHTHAVAAAMAMQMGKHCFCQKPLTRTLYEARYLADLARQKKVATQMGNQGTADDGLRAMAMRIRKGMLGTVREIHIWTNRPIWPQGHERSAPKDVPPHLDWDLWIGPSPYRPYGDNYHTFSWRGWWDFGTGALGDMGCHTINMAFMALDLRNPVSVQAKTSGHNRDSFPKWSIVTYQFAATRERPALTLVWYDGGQLPPAELLNGEKPASSGSLLIGDKDRLYTPGDYGGGGRLLSGAPLPEVDYPRSPGHIEEFIRAIKGGEPAMSNFPNYAGPLTETVLVGNLAVWADGPKVEWDARRLRARGMRELDPLIKPVYRKGYALG
ncbi:MAG: Gfo/Idh/MocA family oxidoreductase [Chloroherpetonaceae bacterium]|nr:Gfo/Idh/MocA family oxidoreductase [Chthonomonadaceae bacterium]MDW8206386.1 Gfo/Idh/MocA family oxidoreductase [Chloroherpetonaceae bacterium]